MAGRADGAQIAHIVCTALGPGLDVINLGCWGELAVAQARLAEPHVAVHDVLAELAPLGAVASLCAGGGVTPAVVRTGHARRCRRPSYWVSVQRQAEFQ